MSNERLAARLAVEANGRNHKVRSPTFGAYLTNTWLPGKTTLLVLWCRECQGLLRRSRQLCGGRHGQD